MGHLGNHKELYAELRERIDSTQSGLAETPEVYDILRHLFTQEEAAIAVKLPITPRRIGTIARRTGISKAELEPKLDRMAGKGLIFDFVHPERGTYYMLAPPVVGFFEMTMMKVRSDIAQPEVARLLEKYLYDRPDFVREATAGRTPLGRALIREETVEEVSSDVLSWERAETIIREATDTAVALCYCRHKRSHSGDACEAPQEICLPLNRAAEFSVRRGFARRTDTAEMLDLLSQAKEAGLVQIADNVRDQPIYICNCCGCCCAQLVAINRHGIHNAVATSNFIATIDEATCKGCGKCTKACPIQAIGLRPRAPHQLHGAKGKRRAEVDGELCLGCGVCAGACTTGALAMSQRPRRVLTPENTLERVMRQAIGRGHLHDLLFDEHDGPNLAFLNRLVGAIERLPLTQHAVLNETLKSRFVGFLTSSAKRDKRQPTDLL